MKVVCVKNLQIDRTWTLFLDRDGVINVKRENDYIKKWSEFKFINGALDALSILSKKFQTIIVVTNQRGVGKNLMYESDLNHIHKLMLREVDKNFGRIDKIYYSIDLNESAFSRKPNPGMAYLAKSEFPLIDFNKSVMVGDSDSDILFGMNLGMKCFLISEKDNTSEDNVFKSLYEFSINV